MLPQAFPQTEQASGTSTGDAGGPGGTGLTGAGSPGTGAATSPGTGGTPPASPGSSSPSPGLPQTSVELSFSADSAKLDTACQAMANLADMASQVTVTVKAQNPNGFDKSKLQNGVLEPLRDANLIQ